MTAVAPHVEAEFVELGINQLSAHPANRKHFDPAKLRELADSIAQVGVHTPLIVRPFDGGYQILAGERRWRAARLAERATVPCLVRELDDDAALELLLTENLQREDPNPLEEANAYIAWLARHPGQVKELAAKLGKSVTHVYSRLQLQALTEEAKALLWSGQLPVTHAQLLARAGAEAQAQAVRKLQERLEYGDGVRSLARLAEDLCEYTRELKHAPFPIADATLVPEAGACGACAKRSGCTDGMFPELRDALVQLEESPSGKTKSLPADTCLDGGCWSRKVEAFVARQRETLRAQYGEALVELSVRHGDTWPARAGAPLPSGLWTKAKKTTPGAVPGLIVHVPESHMHDQDEPPGAFLWVTLKPRPKAGATAKAAPTPTPARSWEEEQKARDARAAVELPRRLALLKAVIAKLPARLPREQLVARLLGGLAMPDAPLKALHLADPTEKGAKATDRDVMLALCLDEVADDFTTWNLGAETPEPPTELLRWAKQVGVNAKAVLAAHDAEVKAGKAAPKDKGSKA